MSKIISIGHINPDTDSALSAILISQFGKKIFGFDVEAAIASDINNETKFALNLLKIAKPKLVSKITDQSVVLVDTTEPGQMVEGINEVNLAAIIDHHNLGGLKSGKPILVRVEPVGCTATVIYKILREKGIKFNRSAAILMIICIISDTLNLTSPTTSVDDKEVLKELNKVAKLNLKKFASELFAAKSSLEGIKTEDIVTKDYKNFDMGKSKVGIGVWETTNPETVDSKKPELMKALATKKEAEKLDYVFFLIVDILKESSIMYILSDKEKTLAEKVFGGNAKDSALFLKGIVSRKKQVVPPLMAELTK